MDPLYQQLKELDSNTFELLCFHLLKARHPGVDIKHVEGAGGDEGLDQFVGELDIGPVVWQCKAFPQGVRAKQKEQINQSLARALGRFSPKKWILCLSVDFDARGHRWFQELARRHRNRLDIRLYQASDIVHELQRQHSIREHFFPNASLNVPQLRALVTGNGELTEAELANLSLENAQQYLHRRQDSDARFNYEITYARDRVPDQGSPVPGLVFTASNGQSTIRAFARDHEALRLSPPKVSVTMKTTAANKLQEFIRTGRGQQIEAGEILSLSTDLPFISESSVNAERLQLKLSNSLRDHIQVPLRLAFGSGVGSIVYEGLLFTVNRTGTEETEIVARPRNLPFEVSVVVSAGQGEFSFSEKLEGADVKAVKKFLAAAKALQTTGTIELYSLESEASILKATINDMQLPTHWTSGFEAFIDELAAMADFFSVPLRLPGALTHEDEQSWSFLKSIMDDVPVLLNAVSFEVVKSASNQQSFFASLDLGLANMPMECANFRPALFGVEVPLGTIRLELGKVQIENGDQAREDWLAAGEGDSVRVSVNPREPVRIVRLPPNDETPGG
jgi:hypothetical protein